MSRPRPTKETTRREIIRKQAKTTAPTHKGLMKTRALIIISVIFSNEI